MCSLSLVFLFLSCFIQNIFTQSLGTINGYGYGLGNRANIDSTAGLAPGFSPYGPGAPFGVAPMAAELDGLGVGLPPAPINLGAYGGTGVGDVEVTGEMPVAGTTLVVGRVPILGAVRFTGDLPASGTVSITGTCGCGCGKTYY